ncbi:MAG: hypothetical protein J7M03_06550 [Candidatus Desulfofervidaceae bacterium]|nr:hypothetical protein [Candidatus Desulfofervidaceae bacterium]MDL1969557.1 hypothetical protein [Candidatus Desulfofervidaceae bacterium]
MDNSVSIYFHRDFDGMVSAALIADYVQKKNPDAQLKLFPVGHTRGNNWMETHLKGNTIFLLDYPFHPQATYWFDHHQTGLGGYEGPLDPERHFFNPDKTSCALLIWEVLYNVFDYRNLNFQELVKWADKIDSARFSLEELIECKEKPLQIHLSLTVDSDNAYLIELTRLFLHYKDLLFSPKLPLPLIVVWRLRKALNLRQQALAQFQQNAIYDPQSKIVFFTMPKSFLTCRWAPYYFYPDCFYALGVIQIKGDRYMIILNENPWRRTHRFNIGQLCASYGGGGHPTVGGITVVTASEAQRIAEEILQRLKTNLLSDKD